MKTTPQRRLVTIGVLAALCSLIPAVVHRFVATADAQNSAIFGPELFRREQGRPQTYERRFTLSDPAGQYNLEIVNGDPDDSADFAAKKNRVSSAQIFLNDVQIVRQGDLGKEVRRLSVPVSPVQGENSLKVTLLSNPVSMLSVAVVRVEAPPAPDLTPPQVIAVEPANATAGVPATTTAVRVTFSERIALDTLSTSTFYVTAGNQVVSGRVEPLDNATGATFLFAAPLAYATTYTVLVKEGIRDLAANPLAPVFTSSFTTEAAPPPPPPDTASPRVVSLSPMAGTIDAQNRLPVVVRFSEPVEATTVSSNLLVFADTAANGGTVVVQDGGSYLVVPNGERVPGVVTPASDGVSATFSPASGSLPANATITVVVMTRVKDLAGNAFDQNPQLGGLQLYEASFSTSAFNLTAPTSSARANPNAALLPGDEAIVSGGYNEVGEINATAEIYNNADGTFRAVMMLEGRAEHTVTVLTDGRVLIAGGVGPNGQVTASAEIFDPRTGDFQPAGAMQTPRFRHSATMLPDGSVLFAGGYNGAALNTAEVFLPAENRFVAVVARMQTARAYHTATSLRDGSVLLCGGVANGSISNTAEVFIPAPFVPQLGQFLSGGGTGLLWKMSSSRFRHTATLLTDGRVLIAGGRDEAGRVLRTADLFTPSPVVALSAFSAAGQLTEARMNHTATLLSDGSLLIAGGVSGSAAALTSAEVYRNGQFSRVRSPLSHGRSSHAALLLSNGSVLLANGEDGSTRLRSAEIYTPRL